MARPAKSPSRSREATASKARAPRAGASSAGSGSPPRVLVHGFYGAGNLGDEAILAAMVADFHGRFEDVELMVVSQDPGETERTHPVRAIDRHGLHGQSALLSQADLLVFGGGEQYRRWARAA